MKILVAEAAEEEGSGAGFGELGDGGAKGPGSGWVVGYIDQKLGAFGKGKQFQAGRAS